MATYTLDWSQTNLGGSAVVSYARGAVLDYTDKPAGATASLSCTRGLSPGDTNLAVFTIVTTGSSVLTFDYKTSTEAGWDKLHIDVDGVSQANYSGVIAWTTHAGISIPTAGTHTIRFRYNKDPGGVNADRVWIAKLQITNTTTVNDDASTVDTYNFEDGAIPSFVATSTWTNSTSEPIAGTRSLRSPTSPANNGSYDMTVTKTAGIGYRAVGFDWKVSSESGWDKLFIYPDSTTGVPAHPTAPSEGSPGWLEWSGAASGRFAVILPAASSSFLLRYAKDGGGAAGSDAAWIDNITLPSAAGGPITGTLSASLPRSTASVTGTIAGPTYPGTLSAATPRATASLSGVAAGPAYAGTASAAVPRAAAVLAGTAAAPVYVGSVGATTPRTTATASGTVTPPSYTGTVAATLGATASSITGSATAPTHLGTLTAPVPPTRAAITGSATNPAGSGSLSGVFARATAALTGTVVMPTWAGTLNGQLTSVTGTVPGVAVGPSFTGTLNSVLPGTEAALDGNAGVPTSSGVLVASLPSLKGALTGVVEGGTALVDVAAAPARPAAYAAGKAHSGLSSGPPRQPTYSAGRPT